MPTDIVFSGGHHIRVFDQLANVQHRIDQHEAGNPLLKFNLAGERDGDIHVNPGAIAYIPEARAGSWHPS